MWQRLVAEHGATVSEVTVSRYVARRRVELGLVQVEVAIPRTHAPGAEAEVDFGEFQAVIAGHVVRCWMFVMRLSHSGRAFHVAFGTQAQEAFIEGHVLAFAHFAGVPGQVRYDNLKPAVTRVLRGRDRVESDRFVALRSHYGFDSFFCRPGIAGAHEKGGVEGEIGRFRRRHLVPVPVVASLHALNELLAAADVSDESRVITGRPRTIAAAFAGEAPSLMSLPAQAFDPASLLQARVDNRARVSVRQCFYPTPRRRHRRPRHVQRPHPRNRHPVLPTTHQQNQSPDPQDGLIPRPSSSRFRPSRQQPQPQAVVTSKNGHAFGEDLDDALF